MTATAEGDEQLPEEEDTECEVEPCTDPDGHSWYCYGHSRDGFESGYRCRNCGLDTLG